MNNYITREIQLSKLTGDELSIDAKMINDLFTHIFSNMKETEYTNATEWIKDIGHHGSIIFMVHDKKRDIMWLENRLWGVFRKRNFGFNVLEIEGLIIDMIELQLEHKVSINLTNDFYKISSYV